VQSQGPGESSFISPSELMASLAAKKRNDITTAVQATMGNTNNPSGTGQNSTVSYAEMMAASQNDTPADPNPQMMPQYLTKVNRLLNQPHKNKLHKM
jgi:hypothetical protein